MKFQISKGHEASQAIELACSYVPAPIIASATYDPATGILDVLTKPIEQVRAEIEARTGVKIFPTSAPVDVVKEIPVTDAVALSELTADDDANPLTPTLLEKIKTFFGAKV